MRRLRAGLRTVILPCHLDQDLITARLSVTPVCMPVRCITTPALFSNHRSLAPVIFEINRAGACAYGPGNSETSSRPRWSVKRKEH